MSKDNNPARFADYQARDACSSLIDKLVDCFDENFGEGGLALGLTEFFLWPDEMPDEEVLSGFGSLLYTWLLFFWVLGPDEAQAEGIPPGAPVFNTTAELLEARSSGRSLSPIERKILEAGLDSPISYWEIVAIERKKEVNLRDIFGERSATIIDEVMAESVQVGDIIYAQVLTIEGTSVVLGAGPAILPPRFKAELIGLRDQLVDNGSAVDLEIIEGADFDLREMYFNLLERLTAPVKMVNHDGEPVIPHTIRYEIDSPDFAVEKLHELSVTESLEEVLDDAEKDDAGHVRKAEITWNREEHDHPQGWTNTVLGRIAIDGNRLVAEVNSVQRAERIRSEIEARLGDRAIHKGTSLQSPESMMKEMRARGQLEAAGGEGIDLEAMPELQQALTDMIVTHWRNWVDMEIPALDGKTPKQAVRTRSGREAVEALLMDAERSGQSNPHMEEANLRGIREARRVLGLD